MSEQESENRNQDSGSGNQEEERMRIISETIKSVAAMSQVGLTYCIVIPGYGVREDSRLVTHYIAPPKDKSIDAIVAEVSGNAIAILQAVMSAVRKTGYSDDVAEGILQHIVDEAKQRYQEAFAGVGEGAGPMRSEE